MMPKYPNRVIIFHLGTSNLGGAEKYRVLDLDVFLRSASRGYDGERVAVYELVGTHTVSVETKVKLDAPGRSDGPT